MTEPIGNDDLKVLDDLEEGTPKKSGYGGIIFFGLVIAVIGFGSIFLWMKPRDTSAPAKSEGAKALKGTQEDAKNTEVVNFAERFTIMTFNMSYTDISRQVEKVSNLMSDNLMSYYQDTFLDPKWVAFLSDNKAYVTFQGIDRSMVENTDGTHYWVRIIGKCLYNSDARGPGSQIELPFRLVVVVKNDNGKLIVTNFQRQ
jgi:hypothetical protein